jgi:hypothetical protein
MKWSEVVVNLARSKWNDSDYEMIILIEAILNVLIQIFFAVECKTDCFVNDYAKKQSFNF